MGRRLSTKVARREIFAAWLFALGLLATTASNCVAECGGGPLFQPAAEIRAGGVLEESYSYHRQPQAQMACGPAGGWYGYGFPVSTFRWGWFGAQHYYPRVFWHDSYYGECCRYSYRRGY